MFSCGKLIFHIVIQVDDVTGFICEFEFNMQPVGVFTKSLLVSFICVGSKKL